MPIKVTSKDNHEMLRMALKITYKDQKKTRKINLKVKPYVTLWQMLVMHRSSCGCDPSSVDCFLGEKRLSLHQRVGDICDGEVIIVHVYEI